MLPELVNVQLSEEYPNSIAQLHPWVGHWGHGKECRFYWTLWKEVCSLYWWTHIQSGQKW